MNQILLLIGLIALNSFFAGKNFQLGQGGLMAVNLAAVACWAGVLVSDIRQLKK